MKILVPRLATIQIHMNRNVRSSKSLKSSCFMLETPKLCRFHALEMGPWYWLEMVGKGCELINALHDIAVPSWKKEKQSKIIWIQENGSLSFQNCRRCHSCGSSRAQDKNYISNFYEWHSSLNSARHTFHKWCFNAESIGIILKNL